MLISPPVVRPLTKGFKKKKKKKKKNVKGRRSSIDKPNPRKIREKMASRVAGVLIVCLVLAATFGMGESVGDLLDAYRNCFVDCHKTCQGEGNGNTFCEMKCDGDCMAQETAAKLNMQP